MQERATTEDVIISTKPADHEQAAAFGPCRAGESFFCQGAGTERLDPLDPFAANIIICYPCSSHREAQIVTDSLERVLAA